MRGEFPIHLIFQTLLL